MVGRMKGGKIRKKVTHFECRVHVVVGMEVARCPGVSQDTAFLVQKLEPL
jgi:hypothetical protein